MILQLLCSLQTSQSGITVNIGSIASLAPVGPLQLNPTEESKAGKVKEKSRTVTQLSEGRSLSVQGKRNRVGGSLASLSSLLNSGSKLVASTSNVVLASSITQAGGQIKCKLPLIP